MSIELNACVSNQKTFKDVDTSHLDGVYLGQPYCLKYAGNFIYHGETAAAAVAELRARGKKAYLTTPAIPTPRDMSKITETLRIVAEAGVDGIEAHDVGIFRWVRRELPDIPVFVGNFANVYNENTAALWGKLGASRVIPNHELTGTELDIITASHLTLEFERPVHGLLPLGMAFACLLSDDTEGHCRQQCSEPHFLEMDGWRMRSVGTSLLTGEDYCLIEHLADLLKSGLTIFRIESHFESAGKINRLSAAYREALTVAESSGARADDSFDAVRRLAEHGLCNGWHFGRSGREYIGAGDSCVD